MRIRFSLRTMLVLFTIATIFLGWRINQRTNLQLAAKRIQEQGGTIFYRWQSPKLINYPITVADYISTAVSYTHLTPPTKA